MKILLTGGTGFIGGPVTRALERHGLDFTLAVYEHDPHIEALEKAHTVERVNLLAEQSRTELLRKVEPDVLMHLAWYAEPNNFWQSPLNMEWVYASLDLFRRFTEQGGTRCLITGTCAEYDWSEGGCFNEEMTPAAPTTFYGIAKDALRRVCQGYAGISGTSLLWCRLFWPYGPGEPEGRLFSSMLSAWREGQTATCRAGNLKRDYMHVDDIADALVAALLSREEGIMNIASGTSVPLGELASVLAKCAGREDDVCIDTVVPGPGNPEEVCADITRLQRVGTIPKRSFADGFATLVQESREKGTFNA